MRVDFGAVHAVLLDFTGVVAEIRPTLIGEEGPMYRVEPNIEVIDSIYALRQHKVPTCLVSNNDRDSLIEGAPNIDFMGLFDEMVFSSDSGFTKPDRRIYLEAATRMTGDVGQCLFIDDLARNVDAAIHVGMQGVIADSSATVVETIAELIRSLESR